MKKAMRIKLIREQIINKLEKYDRRIRQMAENAYKLRQFLETLDKQENENALCDMGSEGSVSSGSTDRDAGQPDISDPATIEAVLDEQSSELPNNS